MAEPPTLNKILILSLFAVSQGYVTIQNPCTLQQWSSPYTSSTNTILNKLTSMHHYAQKRDDDENQSPDSSSIPRNTKSSSNNSSTSSSSKQKKKKKSNFFNTLKIDPNRNREKKNQTVPKTNILSLLSNPYQAGQSLRQTLDDAFTSLGPKLASSASSSAGKDRTSNTPLSSSSSSSSSNERSVYFFDDRFLESSSTKSSSSSSSTTTLTPGAIAFAQRSNTNPYLFKRQPDSNTISTYIPEVLVIGAMTTIGQAIVQRLLLYQNQFRIRVLVRDLYSRTLNTFGTGVTYCQGHLLDIDSLEYALTDVDKIIFVEGAPKQDEANFRQAFDSFVQDNLSSTSLSSSSASSSNQDKIEMNHPHPNVDTKMDDLEYQSQIVTLRAKLAEQVDCIGMKNLIQAYHNVRHADYGTSQVAKRTLFKFKDGGKKDDFQLFTLMDDVENHRISNERFQDDNHRSTSGSRSTRARPIQEDGSISTSTMTSTPNHPMYTSEENDKGNVGLSKESSSPYERVSSSQGMWIKNKFGHGVFTGRVKATTISGQDQSSIISSRLRSRENPEKGIDLSNVFAGLILRVCSDGKNYQVFIRTSLYESDGIEYVYEFSTGSKTPQEDNKSINKFVTVRVPFSRFLPRRVTSQGDSLRSSSADEIDNNRFLPFQGSDVKFMGFRFLLDSNTEKKDTFISSIQRRRWTKFYLGVSYIKAYRSQADPEFFYLSDARLPAVIGKDMVRHDFRRIVLPTENDGSNASSSKILDEKELKRVTENPKDRSEEELYYKYMGEEIIKNSGLWYVCTIVLSFKLH